MRFIVLRGMGRPILRKEEGLVLRGNMAHKIKINKDRIIDIYAEHWDRPISDFKNFNAYLKEHFGFTTTKEHVRKLLGY
jgi:hypothetical protein